MTPAHLKDTLSLLPDQPGVYKYYDESETIIYIGKAKSLKKRVSSYFNKQQHENRKTAVMVSKINRIEFTIVDSEMDALLLENSLIKEFQPRYNVNLKDDKSYPFIKLTKERFPKVFAMRNPEKDGSEYFGPYASVRAMHIVLDLVKRLYPIRNCSLNLSPENISAGKFRVCLEYQIGNCKGPCERHQSEEEYMESIRNIRHILKGNLAEVRAALKTAMQNAVAELAFERAQELKEKLEYLEKYQSRSTVVNSSIHNVDVYGICSTDKIAFINYLRIHDGMVLNSYNFEYRKKLSESDEELLDLAIAETRERFESTATEIVVPFHPVTDWKGIRVTLPGGGDRKKLLDLANRNALYYRREKTEQYEKLNPALKTDRLMEQMMKDLRLTEMPRHIECFDNSNIQGTHPVSACVVFKDGKPAKSEYRHFNVKTVEGPDDFATMREVVARRYARLIEEGKPLPQLVVIDGGKGQLGAAVEALKSVGVYGKLAVMGIAKRLEELYFPNDPLPLYIDKKSETLKVIQHMRDEAHRFGITHHRKKRNKATLNSELLSVPGIGETLMQKLLREFKSVRKMSMAGEDELSEIIGPAKAKVLASYFKERENG